MITEIGDCATRLSSYRRIYMYSQSLAYSKLQKGKYYEQTEIDGIEVIYVVDWLLQ